MKDSSCDFKGNLIVKEVRKEEEMYNKIKNEKHRKSKRIKMKEKERKKSQLKTHRSTRLRLVIDEIYC